MCCCYNPEKDNIKNHLKELSANLGDFCFMRF